MANELARIGDSAVEVWKNRDLVLEARLNKVGGVLSCALAAADSQGSISEVADAIDEALRQFEQGSIALLMHMTPLVADAGRRMLEIIYFTLFLRDDRPKLLAWQAGAEQYVFVKRLTNFYSDQARIVAGLGAFGTDKTIAVYRDLSRTVHANPVTWNENRDGLKVIADELKVSDREVQLVDAAKCVIYALLAEFRDLEIDGAEDLFESGWVVVKGEVGR